MKKNSKIYRKIRTRRQSKANSRFKEILSRKRLKLRGVSAKERKYLFDRERSYTVVAPTNFSFIENTSECIQTFEKLHFHLRRNQNVFFKCRNIANITDDTIVVLMSVIKEFQLKKISLIGDEPKSKAVCKVFEKSGIANYVEGYITTRAVTDKNGIYSHNNLKVQNELSHQLIGSAAETIWGEKKTCTGVQRVLIECMANTHDHADPKREAMHSWWLSISHDDVNKIVSFSFVDFGVGIFESIKRQKSTVKFINFFSSIFGRYKNNADILKLIFDGELKKSRTGSKNRGNGLPSIAKALSLNQIDNVKIISNDVYADLKNDKFETMPKQFSGTFVYWELNHECINKNWVQ